MFFTWPHFDMEANGSRKVTTKRAILLSLINIININKLLDEVFVISGIIKTITKFSIGDWLSAARFEH